MSVMVDDAFLVQGQTPRGAWTRRQLELVGIRWPPQRDWKARAIGKVITDQEAAEFLAIGRNVAGRRNTPETRCSCNREPKEGMTVGGNGMVRTNTQESVLPGQVTRTLRDASADLSKADVWVDGGVVGYNPSPWGGSYAAVLADGEGEVARVVGTVRPGDVSLGRVTNNMTELLAALAGLLHVPAGWCGTLYTDSQITAYRVCQPRLGFDYGGTTRYPARKGSSFKGIPDAIRQAVHAARARLGGYHTVLVAGHPSERQLADGFVRKGRFLFPCSPHNVLADQLCQEARHALTH